MTNYEINNLKKANGKYELTQEQYDDICIDIYLLNLIYEKQVDIKTLLSGICITPSDYARLFKSKHCYDIRHQLGKNQFVVLKERSYK